MQSSSSFSSLVLLVACALACAGADAVAALDRATIAQRVLERFHSRADVQHVRQAWRNTTDEQIEEATVFLLKFAPARDLQNLTIDFFVDNIRDAFDARETFPWGMSVPWPMFLNDVLPYAVLNENRDPWRPLMLQHYKRVFANATGPHNNTSSWSTYDAVMFMNKVSWEIVNPPIVYKAAPPNVVNAYSVFGVMRAHFASCTGLSVFYTAACRSVGIPTRLAGTPHWNRGPKQCPDGDASDDCGNHDWTEVFFDGGWSFVGLNGGYNAVYSQLNSSWWWPYPGKDQQFGVTNHSINAASWAPGTYLYEHYGGVLASTGDPLAVPRAYFPMVWNWTDASVPAFDATKRYLQIKDFQ